MQRVEKDLEALGCPKVNVQIRSANAAVVAFYEKLGYARDETIVLGKRLIPDE
jgi:ribosomal protein S18 acetylase RimI-like enzyme